MFAASHVTIDHQMETPAHRQLKRLSIAFLRQSGFHAVATEVRCPISRYRIDVAGYLDALPFDSATNSRGGACEPRTVVIECKQSREDFLHHTARTEPLLALRTRLEGIRRSIEEHRIKQLEPQLRVSGTSLFTEMEDWDFTASQLPSYQRVMSKLRRIDEKLHGQTKFFLLSRYRLADQMYVAAPRGLIRNRELPPGWGLLECPPSWLGEHAQGDLLGPPPQLQITVEAPHHSAKPVRRTRLLRNIAVAASYAAERAM